MHLALPAIEPSPNILALETEAPTSLPLKIWVGICLARWKDGNAGTRMSRAVQGGGTWHGSGKRIAVSRHGYRQTFEYRIP